MTLALTESVRRLAAEVVGWRRRELRRILLALEPRTAALTAVLRRLAEVASEGYGTIPHGPMPL